MQNKPKELKPGFIALYIRHENGTGLHLQPRRLHRTLFIYCWWSHKASSRLWNKVTMSIGTSEAGWTECRLVISHMLHSTCCRRLVSGPRQQVVKCRRPLTWHTLSLHRATVTRRCHTARQPTHRRNHLQQLTEVASARRQQLSQARQNVLIQLPGRHRTHRFGTPFGMPCSATVTISAVKPSHTIKRISSC